MFPSPQLTRNELAVCCFLQSKELRSSMRIEKIKKVCIVFKRSIENTTKVIKELGEAFLQTKEAMDALSSMW